MYSGLRFLFGFAGALMILKWCYSFFLFGKVEPLMNLLGGAILLALSIWLARKG